MSCRRVTLVAGQSGKDRHLVPYGVADTLLWTEVRCDALEAFRLPQQDRPEESSSYTPHKKRDQSTRITYRGKGLMAGGLYTVVCYRESNRYLLAIDEVAEFDISPDGHSVTLIKAHGRQSAKLLSEIALGTPVVLALALQSVFCIHASVVRVSDKLVAFVGESGHGKSTLASFLDRQMGANWRKIIDDTLPVTVDANGEALALPHFPQLKLPPEAQPIRLIEAKVPLDAVYVLGDVQEGDSRLQPTIETLARRDATLALVRHTVGARLFDRALLAEHLQFCAAVASKVRVARLEYPRRFEVLPAVGELLAQDIASF